MARSSSRSAKKPKTVKKSKKQLPDPAILEQRALRISAIKEKRQKVINQVEQSLQNRRMEIKAIQSARFEKEARLRVKQLRDAGKTGSDKAMMQIREDLSRVIETGVNCVYTSVIIPEKIKYDGKSILTIKGVKYRLKNNLHMVGWGKEAIMMSSAIERIVGKQLRKGLMVVPRKSLFMMWCYPEAFPKLDSRISYVEAGSGGDPDEKTVLATRKILHYCKKLKKRDLLLVMLSKETDDLLCCPRETISLRDKLRVVSRLNAVRATPEEINTVRNKLSAIRGGDLARFAYPARIIVLITSDVTSNPMTPIVGGPCTYDPKDETALNILTKYKLINRLPLTVRDLVEETIPWTMAADKQLDANQNYKFVQEYVIACNADAMECMSTDVFRLGLFPVKLSSTCFGSIQEFAREYVKMASLMILAVEGKIDKLDMYEEMKDSPVCPLTDKKVQEIFPAKDKWGLGLCLLLGGQPTVQLSPNPGYGGPNQELALYFSLYWYIRTQQQPILREYTVWFAGGSSYGKDGNTEAAGAFGYKGLGTDIYTSYEKTTSAYRAAKDKWQRFRNENRTPLEIAQANQEMFSRKLIRDQHFEIFPHKVLAKNNTNLLFSSINDKDDLVELKSGNYYTFTNVGDLHLIRIVRFQCICDSRCHEQGERICDDIECPVTHTLSAETKLKARYCCDVGTKKSAEPWNLIEIITLCRSVMKTEPSALSSNETSNYACKLNEVAIYPFDLVTSKTQCATKEWSFCYCWFPNEKRNKLDDYKTECKSVKPFCSMYRSNGHVF